MPNRIDRRTLEGRQLVEELEQFGEEVAPALTNRSAYVRCFAAGELVATLAVEEPADLEVRALADIVEPNLCHPNKFKTVLGLKRTSVLFPLEPTSQKDLLRQSHSNGNIAPHLPDALALWRQA